jgi:hypothetical protein
MKRMLLILAATILLLVGGALSSDKKETDFPLSAHILGTARHRGAAGTTSVYNSQTGQWSYGTYEGASTRETELQIDKMVYTVREICKEIEVGKDYPASIDNRRIHLLLPDGKTCNRRIEGTHETE